METKSSFGKFEGKKQTSQEKIRRLKMGVDEENKKIYLDLKKLERSTKEARGDEKKTLEHQESYLRADLAATQKVQEILLRAQTKLDSFGVPESVPLLSIENGWRGPDGALNEVRFTREGIENLETYFKGLERLSRENPQEILNNPLVAHKTVSFLYEDRRRNPIPFGDALKNVLSKMKPEEEIRWATDADNATIVVDRKKVQQKSSGYEYPVEVVRIRVEIAGAP